MPINMRRKTFLCSYLTDKDGVVEVDEEQAIQKALAEAMRDCGCQHFVVAPPDLVKGGIQEVEE